MPTAFIMCPYPSIRFSVFGAIWQLLVLFTWNMTPSKDTQTWKMAVVKALTVQAWRPKVRSPTPTDMLSGRQIPRASRLARPAILMSELLTQWINEGAMDHDPWYQPQASTDICICAYTDMKNEGGTQAMYDQIWWQLIPLILSLQRCRQED